MKKVYVIIDQDSELIGVATNLNAIKEIIANEFIEYDSLDMRVEKTCVGYEIKVKEDRVRFRYNAYYMPVTGGIEDESI